VLAFTRQDIIDDVEQLSYRYLDAKFLAHLTLERVAVSFPKLH